MANTLGVYKPIFYAQEALIILEKALGMAARVHRGFDAERRTFNRGEYVSIRKPSTFAVADASATAQDLSTETVQIQLAHWREVKFKLTDKELAFTQERIVAEHIAPAAYALADDVDQKLSALYKDIPWYYDLASTTEVGDVTGPRKILFNNKVPLEPGRVHYMVDGALEEGLLKLAAFSQQQGAGDLGVLTQMRGSLGMKYGLEVFANQNVQSHTKGTADTTAVAVVGTTAKGATTISLDALALTGTVVPGDTFVIAGNTQRYAITNTVTAAGNTLTGVTFTPALVADAADDAAVTLRLDNHTANLAFHRNAFALVTAPLPDIGKELGAKVETLYDDKTGLSIRSRLYYVGNSSEVHVALDLLYGLKTLDPNLAVRCCG